MSSAIGVFRLAGDIGLPLWNCAASAIVGVAAPFGQANYCAKPGPLTIVDIPAARKGRRRVVVTFPHADRRQMPLMAAHATLIGFAGVALLLAAFLLNLLKLTRSDGAPYAALNCVGAAVACYSSYLIDFMPFVLLEGVWALVAGGALVRGLAARRAAQ